MFYALLAEAKQTCSSVKNLRSCLYKSSDSKQALYRFSYYQSTCLSAYFSLLPDSPFSRDLYFLPFELFESHFGPEASGNTKLCSFINRGNPTACGRMSAAYWYEIMERIDTGVHIALTHARHIEWYKRPQEPKNSNTFTVNNRELSTAIGTASNYPIIKILGTAFTSQG